MGICFKCGAVVKQGEHICEKPLKQVLIEKGIITDNDCKKVE